MNNLSFISNNVKGIQTISKRIKTFENLKITSLQMVSFLFKKHTFPSKIKKYDEVTNSKDSCFSFIVKPTPVLLLLVLSVQKNVII